jgi:hypothetical protein
VGGGGIAFCWLDQAEQKTPLIIGNPFYILQTVLLSETQSTYSGNTHLLETAYTTRTYTTTSCTGKYYNLLKNRYFWKPVLPTGNLSLIGKPIQPFETSSIYRRLVEARCAY